MLLRESVAKHISKPCLPRTIWYYLCLWTWFNDLILDKEILSVYTIHRKNRHDNLRGGAVLVAEKNELRQPRRASFEEAQSELLMIEQFISQIVQNSCKELSMDHQTLMKIY